MSLLFNDFISWEKHCAETGEQLYQPVLAYEIEQKGRTEAFIWQNLARAYVVMKEAVQTGLTDDMRSRSGMVNNSGKKVANAPVTVLSGEFQMLVARALSAKEVNSCMGRVVAAPTAGASGILPSTLTTLQDLHQLPDQKIHESLLVAAGIALIIEQNASLAGAVGGCQAETGSAAAMASGAIVYCLGGDVEQVFTAVAITIQCMLGLVCDPVAGLVEVPCIVRNASAAAIAFSSAQMALAGVNAVIPVDQCVAALGEVGESMERRYKETAEGGLANTPKAREIEKLVLVQDVDILPDEPEEP
ncbi:L-serine ammonia-lyase, iron-sulfur-dependent, subunit alpha [Pontibacter qinzhouensis]|uniref:L-serine dehydratase n=1 Tax=Pontibacter qinzhouensis TaxID=2603253 RepID=A0A5C8JHH5_9BACT|nr:L-serine ammonia-lyase, iron-sulfur-dependent, subunit alpha [Pontibacter qinzhouensis]TXK37780.1 L-serine ammonia-lyase, iron-sulfur-dependent, subunit alpha [Pontibacter qinzhouensis]